jgi:predicted RNA binding protein YcfA (HicA-like mRNA interferase family)
MGRVFKWREVKKQLRKAGFRPDPNHKKTSGSHEIWVNPETGRKTLISEHRPGDDVKKGTLAKIERDAGIKFK